MADRFDRTRLLIGEPGLARLRGARVGVIGLGGVGGYALEALTRAGVGRLFLLDGETFDETNLNRQVLVTTADVGRAKVDVARERVLSVNPDAQVETRRAWITPENVAELIPENLTAVVDAIDDVAAKVELIALLHGRSAPLVSCMGAGGRLETEGLRVADISATRGCPLARVVRRRLRQKGIARGVTCVFFERPGEDTRIVNPEEVSCPAAGAVRRPIGSISYAPGLVGLTAAGAIIQALLRG